jgi:hypothetical protein
LIECYWHLFFHAELNEAILCVKEQESQAAASRERIRKMADKKGIICEKLNGIDILTEKEVQWNFCSCSSLM